MEQSVATPLLHLVIAGGWQALPAAGPAGILCSEGRIASLRAASYGQRVICSQSTHSIQVENFGESEMQMLVTIVGPFFAIVGVLVGGAITFRSQRRNQEIAYLTSMERERQDACVRFLTAVRQYRRFLMYSDPEIEEIPPSDASQGTVIVAGRTEYDASFDEAFSRLLIAARSEIIIEEAEAMGRLLGNFIKARARHGKGMVPNELVKEARIAERSFAALVRTELDRSSPLAR